MKRSLMRVAMVALAVAPGVSFASEAQRDSRMEAMAADVIAARPVGVVATAVGGVAFIVSLPFSLIGGNAGEAFQTLFVGPARETFVRCLGCPSVHLRHAKDDG